MSFHFLISSKVLHYFGLYMLQSRKLLNNYLKLQANFSCLFALPLVEDNFISGLLRFYVILFFINNKTKESCFRDVLRFSLDLATQKNRRNSVNLKKGKN